MTYIRPLHLKQTCPGVHLWNLKSYVPNKQILWILEPLDLLSILATRQWDKQINLNLFFLGLHIIVEIYQIRTNNWIKSINPNKINKLWCIAYHQNKTILILTITWFNFVELLDNFLFNCLCYLNFKIFLYNRVFINLFHNFYFKFFFYKPKAASKP